MNRLTRSALWLVLGMAVPGFAMAQEGTWVSLFDGKSLEGWTALELGKVKGGSKWEVKDGLIEGSGTQSMLFSPRGDYKNFRFRAELKINDGGNSGMYIRTPKEATFSKGYEIQVNSTHKDPVKTGSVYTYVLIYKQLVPPDTFFTQEIEAIDVMYRGKMVTKIKITVNGEVLYEFQDHDRSWTVGALRLPAARPRQPGDDPQGRGHGAARHQGARRRRSEPRTAGEPDEDAEPGSSRDATQNDREESRMANLFVRKSIAALKAEAEISDEHSLKRTLTATNLVMLGIGAIIGAGFFVLTGHAAAEHAGPAVALSFVLGGIVCAFAGLCYAEMASTVPIAGSAYTYAYATMGEFIAWLIGWDLILEYAVGATTVAIGWSGYVVSFLGKTLGIHIPPALTFSAFPGTRMINIPEAVSAKLELAHGWVPLASVQEILIKNQVDFAAFPQLTAIINLPAMLVVAALTALLVVGIQESANVNNVIVVIKVAIVLIFIVVGIGHVSTKNWGGPFIPPNTGDVR